MPPRFCGEALCESWVTLLTLNWEVYNSVSAFISCSCRAWRSTFRVQSSILRTFLNMCTTLGMPIVLELLKTLMYILFPYISSQVFWLVLFISTNIHCLRHQWLKFLPQNVSTNNPPLHPQSGFKHCMSADLGKIQFVSGSSCEPPDRSSNKNSLKIRSILVPPGLVMCVLFLMGLLSWRV